MPPSPVVLSDDLKREVGQHFIVGFHGHDVSADVESLIREYYVGNIIIMKRNVQSIAQLHGLIQKLQRIAQEAGHPQPLLIGIDQENGLVSAFSPNADAGTQFPGAMALAATSSVEITELVANATGREMKLTGLNWAFSPVADVNSDPKNPVIGVRSFGNDPHEVSRFAVAVAKGLTNAGIAPCAKHFPGHGDTHTDSHLALPKIMKSRRDIMATELIPFKSLIANDVASIMTGHMAMPLIMGDDMPSSLSAIVTGNLLRVELGFPGVIVTDCLEMAAISRIYGVEGGTVEALQSGADLVMICHTMERQVGAIRAMYQAIQSGSIVLDELQESTSRVQDLKAQFAGNWEQVTSGELDSKELSKLKDESKLIAKEAYQASTTWINAGHLFNPMTAVAATLILIPRMESLNPAVDDESVLRTADGRLRNTAGPSYIAFANSVAQRASNTKHFVYHPPEDKSQNTDELFSKLIPSTDSIVFVTRNAWDTSAWQIDFLEKVLAACQPEANIVVVASCGPYDINTMASMKINPRLPVLCTFEFTQPALEIAAAVLFGELHAIGRSPVT